MRGHHSKSFSRIIPAHDHPRRTPARCRSDRPRVRAVDPSAPDRQDLGTPGPREPRAARRSPRRRPRLGPARARRRHPAPRRPLGRSSAPRRLVRAPARRRPRRPRRARPCRRPRHHRLSRDQQRGRRPARPGRRSLRRRPRDPARHPRGRRPPRGDPGAPAFAHAGPRVRDRRRGRARRSRGDLEFQEHGLWFSCPAPPAQKTGAYLDQRDNRRLAAQLAVRAAGPMLDLGCHVGGFVVHAAAAGVTAIGLDQSARALEFARRNAARNDLTSRTAFVQADMFGALDHPDLAGPFGVIVFDPPRIATGSQGRERAVTAMARSLGRLLPRLRPGGFLLACSCSHHVGRSDLDAALLAAGARDLARVHALGPGPDHPVWPGHAEGEYLRVNVYQRRAV
ncbi:class I SAM-dependent methyltransferase [Nannocystis sp. RBIL2]|uniref:methyltransferase domain-containing protein n=1 Tax=Nannocystis sp. RBIL2 TaxID=2996788 RepID=UPI002271BDCD|nr:class I SAM-dependent methyltransferase [Nannocystis sp. RBIL2]MCY1070739.1 class I SAM-dependent methyltransferase [Nannocystis sp. RBIL2]